MAHDAFANYRLPNAPRRVPPRWIWLAGLALLAIATIPALTLAQGHPTSSPAPAATAPGIDPEALHRLVERAAEAESDALIVEKDGELIGDWRFGKVPGRIEAMSATKSIVSLALGRLLADGRLDSLDAPVHRFFPEWNQGRKLRITIRHLLTQRSGLQCERTTEEIYRSPDFVQLALAAELTDEPGAVFRYNNKACNLLAGIVERSAGKRMDMLIGEEIFAPLGITDWSWSLDSAGNPHAMSGLQIRAEDLVKIGRLMLEGGVWDGKPVLPPEFVREAVRDQVHPAPDSRVESIGALYGAHYGHLWWILDQAEFAITDRLLDEWRRHGATEEFLSTMETLKALRGDELVKRAIELAGGEQAWGAATFETGRPDFDVLSHRNLCYSAEGYLGQFLVVVPAHRLIAVRMRRASAGGVDERSVDFLRDFKQLVLSLVNERFTGW